MNELNPPDYMDLLPADVLARFAQGKIAARGFVEGFKSGDHRSPYLGTSTEFAEHREYSTGDDPRDLDWRVYGKMDRYYVKQYVEETNLRATILLDTSASMNVGAQSRVGGMSKIDYARRLAAIISYLLIRQGDAVGLVTFDSQVRSFLPAVGKASHLQRILQTLNDVQADRPSVMSNVIHEIAEKVPRRGIVILISDFMDDVADVIQAMYHMRHRRHELIVFHVLTDDELTFPFERATEFRDIEGVAGQLDVDPQALRRRVLASVRRLPKGTGARVRSATSRLRSVQYEGAL